MNIQKLRLTLPDAENMKPYKIFASFAWHRLTSTYYVQMMSDLHEMMYVILWRFFRYNGTKGSHSDKMTRETLFKFKKYTICDL